MTVRLGGDSLSAMSLDEIKQEIAKLSADDRSRLRAWLMDLDVNPGETAAHKLGRLAGRALSELRKRSRDP